MLDSLVVFRSLLEDPVVRALSDEEESTALSRLLAFAEENGVEGDILPYYLFDVLAQDDNVFSRTVELTGSCGASLSGFVHQDISVLLSFLEQYKGLLPAYAPSIPAPVTAYSCSISAMVKASSLGVDQVYKALFEQYKSLGRSVAARYIALAWNDGLTGIEDFDAMPLADLVGLDIQKRALTANTLRLLEGRSANNVLLFGDSGTGKSSCVKALIHEYHEQGLRLLELRKHQLVELDHILSVLGKSKYKYIVFLDDLSFEDGDMGYKSLKAVLEGKAAKIPANVLFYATSNRMHLVRETWADRVGPDRVDFEREDVHISDTVQEKLSLSERFGLTVSFTLPSQAEYLAIVNHLCAKRNIRYDGDIERKALQWAIHQNGFSGRTARQFISSLD